MISEGGLIVDDRVFADDHLPRTLEHRSRAVASLTRHLQPAVDGQRAEDILLHGPSGVGKTALARHALQRLNKHTDVDVAHVETLGMTTGDILRDILRQHSAGVHLFGTEPVRDLVDTLTHATTRPCIVVLDEADDLPDTDVLQHLRNIGLLSVIIVVHDVVEWLPRAPEAETATEIPLDRYGVSELADILETRARLGLREGVVGRRQLEAIADETAGVARDGIQSLWAAAEIATDRGHDTVKDADVADCYERARRRIRQANLGSLPVQHQVVHAVAYALSADRGHVELPAGDLHEFYDELGDRLYAGIPQQPISRRARRTKLSKLDAYDLVAKVGPPQNRRYQIVDPQITPALELPGLESKG